MTDTPVSLLDRLKEGSDRQSWNELAALYTPLLRRWLRRYDSLQEADADDLVQEVLATVSRELADFQHNERPGSFRSWLRTILVNRLRHFWRTRNRHPRAVGGSDFQRQVDELADQGSAISRVWDLEHDRHVMQQLLQEMESRFSRETWIAFRRQVFDARPAPQVAAELNMPLHSVYAAKSRVLSALRRRAGGLIG